MRDILALDIDVAALLPGDSASYGFDNMAGVLKVSESLMERYLSAARRISRAASARRPRSGRADLRRLARPAAGRRVEGLPFGTRGGTLITHLFPQDAEYVFRFDLANLRTRGELDFMLDGERVKLFTITARRARRWTPTATSRSRTSRCGSRSKPARTRSPQRS